MRILLANANPHMLQALRFFLEQQSHFYLVGEVTHTERLLARITDTIPDVVLLDWDLPGQPDSKLLDLCQSLVYPPKIVALGGQPKTKRSALRAGAHAYASRSDPPEKLLEQLVALKDAERQRDLRQRDSHERDLPQRDSP